MSFDEDRVDIIGQNGNEGLHYTPYSLNIDREYPPHIVIESCLDKNVEAVKAAFTERAKRGYEKYGTTTERTDIDLKGWLQHLQEELMDAVVYIERIKGELNNVHK